LTNRTPVKVIAAANSATHGRHATSCELASNLAVVTGCMG
jgi:hypothetical protein